MIPKLVDLVRRLLKALIEPFTIPVKVARDVVTAVPELALIVLAAVVVAGVLALRGNRVAAVLLIPLSLGWLVLNRPFEGPTLIVLSWSHGITLADLVSFAGLGVSGWRLTQAILTTAR